MILVIGGRSKIGSALITNLVTRGESVRALVRPSEQTPDWGDRAETVTGDLGDRRSLRSAMEGAARVFLLCGPTPDEVHYNRNAIDVAREARVELLVRSSILGADVRSPATFVRDHGECDDYLKASGLAYCILRPNMFMQTIQENTIPSIDADGHFFTNAGEARLSMIDTRDIADVAAVVLTNCRHEGRSYDLTGPEALSYDDVAAMLSTVMGRSITYQDVPDDAVRTVLGGYGMGEWFVNALVDLFAAYRASGRTGYAAQVTDTVTQLTGHPARSLEQLLAESPPA
ncbi:MAG TPA: SDR family oxidoreductase [Acidimicrobiales bacterium]|nr:SDR family oxidoreductase [Acidimicrobiales bacterium]